MKTLWLGISMLAAMLPHCQAAASNVNGPTARSADEVIAYRSVSRALDLPGAQRLSITGVLGDQGKIVLDPNRVILSEFGDELGTTLVGPKTIFIHLGPVNPRNPDPRGRRLYDLVAGGLPARLRLVVPKDPQDSPRLLELDEQNRTKRVIPLERDVRQLPTSPTHPDHSLPPRELKFEIIGLPLSSNYIKIEWTGSALQYSTDRLTIDESKPKTVTPSPEQWKRFWQEMAAIRLWDWQPSYRVSGILDGTVWRLAVEQSGPGGLSVTSGGRNGYPQDADPKKIAGPREGSKAYSRLIAAFRALVGEGAFR